MKTMKIIRKFIAFTAIFVGMTGWSGDSAPFLLDTIEPLVETVKEVSFSYNSAWIGGNASAEVVISADGTEIKRTTGEGEFAWVPTTPGKHTLTYTTYIDGVAQEEVYTATVFKDWKYTVDDGKATIIETTQTSGNVVIPSEIDGLPIVGLDEELFNGCEGITSIVIPDSVNFICFRLLSDLEQNDWELLEDESDDELVVYKSNDINHNGSTYMTLDVEGPLELSFDWKVSSESRYDCLKWYLDGAQKSAISGTDSSWQTVTSSIPAGEHTIKWQYSKDRSVDRGEDCGWVRLLRIWMQPTFEGCTNLTSITISSDFVTRLSDMFPDSYDNLTSITLTGDINELDNDAFVGCSNIVDVTLFNIGSKTLSDLFPDSYDNITSVRFTGDVIEIPDNAFAGCSALSSFNIPDDVTTIGTNAFKDCSSLTSLVIPDGVIRIAPGAFDGCTSLSSINLPDGLVDWGLDSLPPAMRSRLETYDANGFCIVNGWLIGYNNKGVSSLEVPEGVVGIGSYALSEMHNLQTLTLPQTLRYISHGAFAGCSSLDSFMVPASVTSLGSKIVSSGTSAIYYLGDAPSYAEDVYADAKSSLVSYVVQGTLGWDGRPNSRDIPQRWNERAITAWQANRFDVTFDAAGGTFTNVEASTYACEQVTDIAYALPPFDPVRTGYEFSGYWTAVAGGTRITSSTRVTLTKAHTLYAHWTAKVPVTVRFNAVGGVVSPESSEYAAGAVYGELPVPTKEHYVFKGWFTRATGGDQVTIASEVPSADHELFAHWEARRYVIRYNAGGGNGRMDAQTFNYGDTVTLRKNSFVKAHHTFAGWATVEGGEAIYADGKTLTEFTALEDGVITLYAVWSINQYSVRFDSHGGVGQMDNQTFVIGVAQKLIPCVYTRSGFKFVGWALSTTAAVSYKDCEEVKDLTPFRNATVTLYAVWEELTTPTPTPNPEPKPEPEPTPDPEPKPEPEPVKPELGKGDYSVVGDKLDGTVPETVASVYDGYLYLNNVVMGTIQAKVSKPKLNKKSGVTTAKTSVAIQVTGEKKLTLKGELNLDVGEFIATDKKSNRMLILKFGSKGIIGTFGKYEIDGARNFFDSKDKSEKSTAEEILKPYLGAYSMILDGGILSVTIAKKGKVTIKGAIDGNKVSAKAQALIGEKMICIPVIYSKKSVNLAFTIWLPINGGDVEIVGLDGDPVIGKAGTLKDGANFVIDGDIGDFIETEDSRTLELLPDNETITVSKSKWLVADGIKPAKVAYKKGEFTITEGKKGAGIVNPSGLKLSYKSKDGSFTGSFTAYAIVKGKLKKHKATVEGILIGDVGYGTITIKKVGTWGVTIE